jgi:hypothetical protein
MCEPTTVEKQALQNRAVPQLILNWIPRLSIAWPTAKIKIRTARFQGRPEIKSNTRMITASDPDPFPRIRNPIKLTGRLKHAPDPIKVRHFMKSN